MRSRKKTVSLVLFLAMMISVFAGCGSAEDKEFSSNGFTVTLPGNAKEMDQSLGYTACYQVGNDIVVAAIEETKSSLQSLGLSEDATVEEYAALVAEVNGYSADDIKTLTGTDAPYFEYSSTVSDIEYNYIGVCYESDESFWFVNFGTTADKFDSVEEDFERWAASVKV